nr:hypothetical protein [Tanacetum cinerariifolium]
MIVQAQEELGEDIDILTDTQHIPTIIQLTTSQSQRKQKPRKTIRKDIELPQTSVPTEVVANKAVYKDMYDIVKRAATTATGLDAEHDMGIISKTQFMATLNKPSFIRTSSGSGPRRQETMGDAAAQTRVLALETTKTNQALEIRSLKRRMKKLEKKSSKRTHKLTRLYKIGSSKRIESSDEASLGDQKDASKQEKILYNLVADERVTLVDETQGGMIKTCLTHVYLMMKKLLLKRSDVATTPTISMDDITLAKALVVLKSAKPMVKESSVPKAKGIVMQEPEETTIRTTTVPSHSSKDKGKAKMIEPEKPLKKKDRIMIDEEVVRNLKAQLQAELEDEERLARQKEEEANIALITEWDDVQAMMDANHELAERLQTEEQGKLTIEERAFDNTMSWINLFVPMDKEVIEGSETRAEGSSKRAGEELESDKSKKQKLDEKNIDREDLETLWKLVIVNYGNTRPEEAYERVLWGDLKVMFEPDIESEVWRKLQGNKVTVWKLFSLCGVQFVRFQNLHIFMLVKKRYTLTPATITKMLNRKLQAGH